MRFRRVVVLGAAVGVIASGLAGGFISPSQASVGDPGDPPDPSDPPAVQSITWSGPTSGTYGDTIPIGATSASGDPVSLSGSNCTLSNGQVTLTAAGTCEVTGSVPDGDHEFRAIRTILVAKSHLDVMAPTTATYGDTAGLGPNILTPDNLPAPGSGGPTSVRGFQFDDDASDLEPPLSCIAARQNPITRQEERIGPDFSELWAGTYNFSCSGGWDSNYEVHFWPGELVVSPAVLTIRADDKSTNQPSTVVFTYTASGFRHDDDAGALFGTPAYSTTATDSSPPGAYAINIARGGLGGATNIYANYTFNFVNGTLALGRLAQTITLDPAPQFDGTVFEAKPNLESLFNPRVSSGLPLTYTGSGQCWVVNGSTILFGDTPGNCTITAKQAGNDQYLPAEASQTIPVRGSSLAPRPVTLNLNLHDAARPAVRGVRLPVSGGRSFFDNEEFPVAIYALGSCSIVRDGLSLSDYVSLDSYGECRVWAVRANSPFKGWDMAVFNVSDKPHVSGPWTLTFSYGEPIAGVTFDAPLFGSDNDLAADIDVKPMCTVGVAGKANVGRYGVQCSPGFDDKYEVDRPTATWVYKKQLTVYGRGQTMTYGDDVPLTPNVYDGFVYGEGPSNLKTVPTCTATAYLAFLNQSVEVRGNLRGAWAGEYDTKCSGGDDPNYQFVYVPSSVTITPRPLVIKADDKTRRMGQYNPLLTASAPGLVNGDVLEDSDAYPLLSTDATSASPVGTYPILASSRSYQRPDRVTVNYSAVYEPGTLTVTKPMLTADPLSFPYGATVPEEIVPAWSGFDPGDSASQLDELPRCSMSAEVRASIHGVGDYPIQCTSGADDRYAFALPTVIHVTKAPLVIKPTDVMRHYGDVDAVVGPTFSGFVNGDDERVLTSYPECTVHIAGLRAGTWQTSECHGAYAANYDINYVPGTVTITKALLRVFMDPSSQGSGDFDQARFTFWFYGFVNGDGPSTLAGTPATSLVANEATDGGFKYSVAVSQGTLRAINESYEFVFAPGVANARYYWRSQSLDLALPANLSGSVGWSVPLASFNVPVPQNQTLTYAQPGFLPNACQISADGLTLEYTSVGYCQVTFKLSGNNEFAPAERTISFPVLPANQELTIEFPAPGDTSPLIWGNVIRVAAHSSADVPVSLTLSGECEWYSQGIAVKLTDVGTCSITATAPGNGTIRPRKLTQSYTVAPLPWRVDALVSTYGADPSHPRGEDGYDVARRWQLNCTTPATKLSPVGRYPIACDQADPRYDAMFPSEVQILPAPLTVSALDDTVPVGQTFTPTKFKVEGFVNSESSGFTGSPVLRSTLNGPAISAGDLWQIYVESKGDLQVSPNYYLNLSTQRAWLRVVQGEQVITSNLPATAVVDDLFDLRWTTSVATSVIVVVSGACDTQPGPGLRLLFTRVGQCSVTISSKGNNDYNDATRTFTTTVSPHTIAYALSPSSMTYGDAVPVIRAVSPQNGSAYDATCTSTVTPISAVGTYAVTCTSNNPNYVFDQSTPHKLTVVKRPLTVVVGNATRAYGQSNPSFTWSLQGLVNGDPASVVTGAPAISSSASATTVPGTYALTKAVGTLAANNYSFVFGSGGVLTITKADQVVTSNLPATAAFGDSMTLSYTTSAGAGAVVTASGCKNNGGVIGFNAVGTCFVAIKAAGDNRYNETTATFSVQVGKAPLKLTAYDAVPSGKKDALLRVVATDRFGNRVAGIPVTFSYGKDKKQETCAATTNASGEATCIISGSDAKKTKEAYTVTFGGNATYDVSSAAAFIDLK